MEQRVKKKYVEKKAPDKIQKPKYIQKQEKNNHYESKQQQRQINYDSKIVEKTQKYQAKYQTKEFDRQRPKKQYFEKPKLVERQSSQAQSFGCIICSQSVRKKDYIWTCQCCFISMHLQCIKTWILNVNKDKNKNEILFLWSCPQCKYSYQQTMPKYYCYCGKFMNPQYERDIEAHTCGKICGRKRGPFCTHPCPQLCHKGKCKPCEHEGTIINCQCGKSSRIIKCSEQRQLFQCGKKCQKILNCLKHKCERNCHHGQCLPCKKKHLAVCYCGKNQDVVDCVDNSYSCKQECGKILNCGFHKCQESCHEGQCAECQRTPQIQQKCPCGRYEIQMLTGDPNFRTSCSDPIPTCGMPCTKLLPCGHQCQKSCHDGKCSDCKIIVEQSCECGLTSRKIQCNKTKKQVHKCENICKRKKNCKMHSCNTICCSKRNSVAPQDHPCELTCQKMLNCGKHTCGQSCHLGLCKKCPVIYSQPQPCPCGKTSLRPPIVCGTIVPQCENQCQKVMQCGHKCEKACHYGPCKCFQETFVQCRCGKEQIKTICGRQTLCLNKCTNQLPCSHFCSIQCHKGSCEEAHKNQPCKKLCQKNRKDCNHICSQHCHPDKKCQEFPCQAQIYIKCECGHRQTSIICGVTGEKKYKKEIKCNKKCQNLKRFDILYKGKEIYYPNNMIHFGLKNLGYLQNVEAKLSKFILESQDSGIEIEFKFNDPQSKLVLLNLFQNHYHLHAYFYRHKKFASFTLSQTQSTMIPKPTLSEYITKISKGQIKRTNLPFEFTVSFECDAKEKLQLILRPLKSYLHKYYLEKKQKSVSIHFWARQEGIRVLSLLQIENSNVEFKGEVHQNEDDIQIIGQSEIIDVEVVEQTHQKKEQTNQNANNQSIGQNQVKQKKEQTQGVRILKTIPPPPEQPLKKKTQGAKIIIKKSNFVFQTKQYPDSKQNVQDIYMIDEDELYDQKVNWDKVISDLISKNMGPQAAEWKIRCFLMISSFHSVDEKIMREVYEKILKMYAKDKEKARRILDIQKLQTKAVKQEMQKDGIYLSDHQPQILEYIMLFNYLATDKIDVEFQEHHLKTMELSQAQEILHAVEYNNFQEFYSCFRAANYVLSCAMIPMIHIIRQNTLDLLSKGQKIPVQDLHKNLLFKNQEQLNKYWQSNGLKVSVKFSKTLKTDAYYMKDGQIIEEKVKNDSFIEEFIKPKRDRKCFLVEPEQLVEDQYMTRSFFAFGDFKESLSNKYIISLVKSLKNMD